MRVYTEFEGDSEQRPAQKGITVRPDLLPWLRQALEQAEAEARAAGLLAKEHDACANYADFMVSRLAGCLERRKV